MDSLCDQQSEYCYQATTSSVPTPRFRHHPSLRVRPSRSGRQQANIQVFSNGWQVTSFGSRTPVGCSFSQLYFGSSTAAFPFLSSQPVSDGGDEIIVGQLIAGSVAFGIAYQSFVVDGSRRICLCHQAKVSIQNLHQILKIRRSMTVSRCLQQFFNRSNVSFDLAAGFR